MLRAADLCHPGEPSEGPGKSPRDSGDLSCLRAAATVARSSERPWGAALPPLSASCSSPGPASGREPQREAREGFLPPWGGAPLAGLMPGGPLRPCKLGASTCPGSLRGFRGLLRPRNPPPTGKMPEDSRRRRLRSAEADRSWDIPPLPRALPAVR